MYRDFSEKSKRNMLNLVSQVENEKWCDFTDWVGDRWFGFQSWIGELDIKKYLNNVNEYHKKVIDKNNTTGEMIEKIFSDVASVDITSKEGLEECEALLNEWDQHMLQMCETVNPCNGLFNTSNIGMLSNGIKTLETLEDILEKTLNDFCIHGYSVVFNTNKDGFYGGDQGFPLKATTGKKEKYYDIFKKNNPGVTLSDGQFENYLGKLDSEGCGYVALINTIFCYYSDDPERFEKAFGYPMYSEDGQCNFDLLLIDIYSLLDNRDTSGKLDIYADYDETKDGARGSYDPWADISGKGTDKDIRKYYIDEFMKKRGINVDYETDVNITVDNLYDILAEGKMIIIAYHDGYLYNMDGSHKQRIEGGHAMVVTGLTDDGKMIVSSWGKQYYIDPNEIVELEYGEPKQKNRTRMSFATVEYQ